MILDEAKILPNDLTNISTLVRLKPFDKLKGMNQSSDDCFWSVADTFSKTINSMSASEINSCFFDQPYFLLRASIDGKSSNVELPKWASDPFKFVY